MRFPHLQQPRTGRLQLLCLQPRLNDVQWVREQPSRPAGKASAEKVPEVRVVALPGADESLEILVDANHATGKWHVHANRQKVRPVQPSESLLAQDVAHALNRSQVLAQLQSLLHD